MSPITVIEHRGAAGELHALPMPRRDEKQVLWLMRPTGTALVMGSAQRPEQFDLARLRADGVELAARRSGGGAVFINPASTVWVDALAPHGSSLWHRDLTENFVVIGRVWQRALAGLGMEDTTLIASKSETTPAAAPEARLACWAGHGWGEIIWRGVKVVGLSQRRTKWGVRLQAMAVVDGSSAQVIRYFQDPHDRAIVEASSLGAEGYGARADTGLDTAMLTSAILDGFRSAG